MWSSPGVIWRDFDAVVVRSCWDYHRRVDEFFVWLDRLAQGGVRVWNPLDVIRWNANKSYIETLDVPAIPTLRVPRGDASGLEAALVERAWTHVVIKPCVSANVGDQFGPSNQHLLPKVFSWFYFAINSGSAVATIAIPYLLDHFGPRVAFGTPGIFMALATVLFWLGRKKFVHIPPGGMSFVREARSAEGLKALR